MVKYYEIANVRGEEPSDILSAILKKHQGCSIVSDVGASGVSGYGELIRAEFYLEDNMLLLIFTE